MSRLVSGRPLLAPSSLLSGRDASLASAAASGLANVGDESGPGGSLGAGAPGRARARRPEGARSHSARMSSLAAAAAAAVSWKVWLVVADCLLIGLAPVLVNLGRDEQGRFAIDPVKMNLTIEACKTVFALGMAMLARRRESGAATVSAGVSLGPGEEDDLMGGKQQRSGAFSRPLPGAPALLPSREVPVVAFWRSPRAFAAAARRNAALALPAALYAVNNYVRFVLQRYFRPTTAKMVSNLKILVIAVLMRVVLHRRFSALQWEALFLLIAGVSVHKLGADAEARCKVQIQHALQQAAQTQKGLEMGAGGGTGSIGGVGIGGGSLGGAGLGGAGLGGAGLGGAGLGGAAVGVGALRGGARRALRWLTAGGALQAAWRGQGGPDAPPFGAWGERPALGPGSAHRGFSEPRAGAEVRLPGGEISTSVEPSVPSAGAATNVPLRAALRSHEDALTNVDRWGERFGGGEASPTGAPRLGSAADAPPPEEPAAPLSERAENASLSTLASANPFTSALPLVAPRRATGSLSPFSVPVAALRRLQTLDPSSPSSSPSSSSSIPSHLATQVDRWTGGALLAVAATMLVPSAASVYNEAFLKGDTSTNVLVQNFYLYLYGAGFNLLGLALSVALQSGQGHVAARALNTAAADGGGGAGAGLLPPTPLSVPTPSAGARLALLALIANNTLQGILSSFFFKFADTILKKYSSALATVVTAVLSAVLFGHSLTPSFCLGVSIVFISMHVFFSTQRKRGHQEREHAKPETTDHALRRTRA